MIHPALKGKQMVFDVKAKPETKALLTKRLKELGFESMPHLTTDDERYLQTSSSGASFWTTNIPDKESTLAQIGDLYDLKPPPLQLEVGKWYRRRDGKVVGPTISNPRHPRFIFQCGEYTYTDNGRICSNFNCYADLIEEATTLPITLVDGTTVEIPVAEHERFRGVK